MNTGIQKSGLTPFGTRTTTTPAGRNQPGAVTHKKKLFEIVAAHGIEYAQGQALQRYIIYSCICKLSHRMGYRHLGDKEINEIIRHRDANWDRILNTWKFKRA